MNSTKDDIDEYISIKTMSDKDISHLEDIYISDEELITMNDKNTRR